MAGRKMRSRKNNSHNTLRERYKSHDTLGKNKILKAQRHEKKVVEIIEYSRKRKHALKGLIEQCDVKFKLGSRAEYILKRVVGTLSITKLKCLLEDIETPTWLQKRPLTPNLKKLLGTTGIPVAMVETMREVPQY